MGSARLSFRRRARRRFYWLLVRGLFGLGNVLPASVGRSLGRRLAGLAARMRPREMARARGNLAIAFPERDAAGRETLLRDCIRLLGGNLFDLLAAGRLLARPGLVTAEELPDRPVFADQLSELAGRGRGVLILTGHLGCWELLGGWLAREVAAAGLGPLAVVTGTIHNEPVDRLVQDRRRKLGLKTLPREAGVRPLLEHLGNGGVAALLLDQNTRVQNEAVPFFGKPAPTASGPARIILRYGVPVLPMAIGREGDGHVVRRLDPILIEPRTEGAADARDVRNLLVECNLALEQMIRRNPAEWVWFHQRWPEGAATTADRAINETPTDGGSE